MAHELWIETARGTASMFYVDDPPWHGLGQRLDNPATSAEAIKAANLDWAVSKRRLFIQQGQAHVPIQDRFAVIRLPHGDEESDVVLGVVGKGYSAVQKS